MTTIIFIVKAKGVSKMNRKIKSQSYRYIEFVATLKRYARTNGNIKKLYEKCDKLCRKYFSEPSTEIIYAAEEYASGMRSAFCSEFDLLYFFLTGNE